MAKICTKIVFYVARGCYIIVISMEICHRFFKINTGSNSFICPQYYGPGFRCTLELIRFDSSRLESIQSKCVQNSESLCNGINHNHQLLFRPRKSICEVKKKLHIENSTLADSSTIKFYNISDHSSL